MGKEKKVFQSTSFGVCIFSVNFRFERLWNRVGGNEKNCYGCCSKKMLPCDQLGFLDSLDAVWSSFTLYSLISSRSTWKRKISYRDVSSRFMAVLEKPLKRETISSFFLNPNYDVPSFFSLLYKRIKEAQQHETRNVVIWGEMSHEG